jgi:hypothetical protein
MCENFYANGFSLAHDIIHTICQIITIFSKTCLIKIKTKTEIDWKHMFENKWRGKKTKHFKERNSRKKIEN